MTVATSLRSLLVQRRLRRQKLRRRGPVLLRTGDAYDFLVVFVTRYPDVAAKKSTPFSRGGAVAAAHWIVVDGVVKATLLRAYAQEYEDLGGDSEVAVLLGKACRVSHEDFAVCNVTRTRARIRTHTHTHTHARAL
jgi:hypothetical protein